jgi:Mg-chelatase subunit ChlD
MKSVKSTYLLLIIWISFGFCLKAQPHVDLIKTFKNQSSLYIENSSRYQIIVKKFQIDGKDYKFGSININKNLTRINKLHPAAVVILEAGNIQYVVHSKMGTFITPTNTYKLMINVDTNVHNVVFEGAIFMVSKSDHLNRNRYNKVAKGVLKKDPKSDYYIDECGKLWRKIEQPKNVTHNIFKTVKFLKLAEGGGEYETIREKLPGENWWSDEFHGPNVVTGNTRGTYNYGVTANTLEHLHFDLETHTLVWGGNYTNTPELFFCNNKANNTTLFLIDRSGSMANKGSSGKPKIEEAKLAATKSIQTFTNIPGSVQEVGVLSFSGSCINDPTASQTLQFSTSMQEAKQRINAIGLPGGGTPLREAVDAATSRLRKHVAANGAKTPPKLIVLSDGLASCQKIRPAGIYASGTAESTMNSAVILQNDIPVIVKYYTIGFDIKPGSAAERDLQYLARSSGGKYLNAQNEFELTRAFQKFYRIYIPKEFSALKNLSLQMQETFKKGIIHIKSENYNRALSVFKNLTVNAQNDFNAVFNLALMYEANSYHQNSIEMYEKYLLLNPTAIDKQWVLKQINFLKQDRLLFLNYIKKVIESDLAYLDLHFKKIQNGESVALAEEFKGFIKEKGEFYKMLPSKLSLKNKQLEISTKEIARSLQKCTRIIKKDIKNWDRNASPILSMTYLQLERLLTNF